jgi:hypothetical protein
VSWQDEMHLLPTRQRAWLGSLRGGRIRSLTGYAEDSPAELLASVPYARRGVLASELFSRPDGPVVISCDGAAPVLVAHSPALASVIIDVADRGVLEAEWPTRFEAIDPVYSEPRFARVIGRDIAGVRVLQRIAHADGRVMSEKLLDRPREAALVLELDDGSQLAFTHDVVDAPNDCALLSDLRDLDASCYRELLALRG